MLDFKYIYIYEISKTYDISRSYTKKEIHNSREHLQKLDPFGSNTQINNDFEKNWWFLVLHIHQQTFFELTLHSFQRRQKKQQRNFRGETWSLTYGWNRVVDSAHSLRLDRSTRRDAIREPSLVAVKSSPKQS